ncbi:MULTISPECIES: hypothetical protein [unclassified Treponema]|uniref:hypothetical protein n=1 Tax=unclassified Treponema TaxID=2638727 RepID=UPI0020A2851E|nr:MULTISPECIES: hypothetical protein [unclassified Treponema]UTC66753.1 hypothetical protein E4O06_12470 [Treponema sp. OMZ 789]UTC69485.1 hypothetical protein E4O01_12610 [Treponema sp. OMZ 790]UTC72199.1 hypothetical protein E4O02_12705 [Treponema sp. OMZ 791]
MKKQKKLTAFAVLVIGLILILSGCPQAGKSKISQELQNATETLPGKLTDAQIEAMLANVVWQMQNAENNEERFIVFCESKRLTARIENGDYVKDYGNENGPTPYKLENGILEFIDNNDAEKWIAEIHSIDSNSFEATLKEIKAKKEEPIKLKYKKITDNAAEIIEKIKEVNAQP